MKADSGSAVSATIATVAVSQPPGITGATMAATASQQATITAMTRPKTDPPRESGRRCLGAPRGVTRWR